MAFWPWHTLLSTFHRDLEMTSSVACHHFTEESQRERETWDIDIERAKTYILRGTPRIYAIKTRAVTDN